MKILWSCVALSLFIGASVSSTGAISSESQTSDAQAVHVLNRLTFGPRPGDIAKVKSMGISAYIEQQLNPRAISESPEVEQLAASSPVGRANAQDLIQEFRSAQQERRQAQIAAAANEKNSNSVNGGVINNANEKAGQGEVAGEKNQFVRQLNQQYVAERLMRDIESPRQLNEVMTEFWFNHFNVFMTKGLDRVLVGPYVNDAIRPNSLGRFRDLLGATCHHPAMLFYLDNWQNTAPNSAGSRGRFNGLNENYARELMELHTLGVDGGYSQKDVMELARVLTGLGLGGGQFARRGGPQPVGPFGAAFASRRHDFGTKILLGHQISGSGEQEVEEALDLLCKQPATAHHVSYKLAQFFVCDEPPASLVNKLADKFSQTDGDIKSVLRELFKSPEFWDTHNENAKYKTPLRYAVSLLRACDAHPRPEYLKVVSQFLRSQGEPVYGCITPDGYKNTKSAWLNPDALLARINFATAIAAGRMPNIVGAPPEYTKLGDTIGDIKFSDQTIAVANKAPGPLKSAVVLGSPEFMLY